MEGENEMVPRLRELLRERGVRVYTKRKKAKLIVMLRDNDPETPLQASPWALHKPKPRSQIKG